MMPNSHGMQRRYGVWYNDSRPPNTVWKPIDVPKINVAMKKHRDNHEGINEFLGLKKTVVSSDLAALLPRGSEAPNVTPLSHAYVRENGDTDQIVSLWRRDREQLSQQQQAKKAKSRLKTAVAHARFRQITEKQIHDINQERFQAEKIKAHTEMQRKVLEMIHTVPVVTRLRNLCKATVYRKHRGLETDPTDMGKLEDDYDLGRIRERIESVKDMEGPRVVSENNIVRKATTTSKVASSTTKAVPTPTMPNTTDQLFPWSETFTPLTQEDKKRKLKATLRKMAERPGRSMTNVTPSLLGIHKMINMETVLAEDGPYETSVQELITAPKQQVFNTDHVKCAYRSTDSGHAIALADGHVFKKQLQTVWPLMGNPLEPLAVRKLRWVGLPVADYSEHMMALPLDQKYYEMIEDWGDGNELLLRLEKAEEEFRYDINDEIEDNRAGWTGVPEFPSSPQQLEAELYHPILAVEEWRRQAGHKVMFLEQISEKSLLRVLTATPCSDAIRLSAIATVIHVRAKFGRVSQYVKLHEAAAAKLGQRLVSEPGLIARAVADALNRSACRSVRRAAAMTLLALDWENTQRQKAVNVLYEAMLDTFILEERFAAIILAHVGEMSWEVLKSVVSYWQLAYFKHDLFHTLLALRRLSDHGSLTASAVAESLNSLEHNIRIKACFTLPFLKCSLTLDVQMRLREILDKDWNSSVRTSAAHSLASLGLGGIVHRHITDLIGSKQPHRILEGLRLVLMLRVASPLILEKVLPCLKTEYRTVQLAALEIVARLKITNTKFTSVICQMTLDGDSTTRIAALQALGCIGVQSPEVRTIVLSAVELDQEREVRRAAVRVVGLLKFSGADVVQVLWTAFEREDDPEHRKEVTRVMKGTGDDVSVLAKHPGRILREAEEARESIRNIVRDESYWENTEQLRSLFNSINHELRYPCLQKCI